MMNRVFSYGLSILSGCILAACGSTSPEVPYSLMCEYLSNRWESICLRRDVVENPRREQIR